MTSPWPAGLKRRFAHSDGRWFEIQVLDCRFILAWGAGDGAGKTSTTTRDDDGDARKKADAKVRKWLRDGFVEEAPRAGRRFDRDADVVDVFRSDPSPLKNGRPRFDYLPVPERTQVFEHATVKFHEWLVCSGDRKRAIAARAMVGPSWVPSSTTRVEHFLDALQMLRDAILDDPTTPLRKLPLESPVGADPVNLRRSRPLGCAVFVDVAPATASPSRRAAFGFAEHSTPCRRETSRRRAGEPRRGTWAVRASVQELDAHFTPGR